VPDILIHIANAPALSTLHPFEKDAPLAPWRFRRCPYERGLYTILVRATGAARGASHGVQIGTTEVVQESHTSSGGTDGLMPTPAGATACPAHQFYAQYNDEIDLFISELLNVATNDYTIWANVEPA